MYRDPPRVSTRSAAAWAGLLALGATLRLWQFGADASQWVDELALSRSIVELSPAALLSGPLPFGQVAPPGFLLLEKAAVALAGAGDYALRLLPLAASLIALVLFLRLAVRLLVRPAAIAFALALFALQPELVRYAAQVKPYAGDLAAALALTLLAGSLFGTPPPPAPWLALQVGVAGVVAVFLSHAAVLVLAGLALGLLLSALLVRRRRALAASAAAISLWAVGGGAALLLATRAMTPRMHAYLYHFWAPSFAPWPHSVAGDARWAVAAISGEIGAAGLGYRWPAFYAGLAVLGMVALWRRRRALSPLLLGPGAVALGAAGLGLYPFASRLVLFIVPALILAIAAGAETLALALVRRILQRGRAGLAAATGAVVYLAALWPALAGFGADAPVYRVEETRPILGAVAARRQPGDAIYVYYGAGQALSFYGPRYGLAPGSYQLGGCHRGDTRAYLHELDRFRGRPRLWVLISHAQPRFAERDALLAYLDHLGTRRLALRSGPHGRAFGLPAEAFLYDLSTAPRLSGDIAASFPIPPAPNPPDPRFACFGAANSVPETPLAARR
ncbi:MAG TPA: hypothetical protein VHR45_09060 [Thermoanaerobaculia bacterium]|nr:hypothetical protein [Thermoanaerobaculia bacterium]